ncbi:hypothetical protein [Brevibacillus laterosporus]|nr:hypothetical protein [Brevibacillus laterosporus]MED1670335.1 hypothetical protein [Brevibacillus laterosporus]MED1717870.1 hypothetical protein [Brevibacillus laterosporus]
MKKLFASSLVLFAFLLMSSSMVSTEESVQLTAEKATAHFIQYSTAPDW